MVYSALVIDDDVWMQRILSKTLAAYGFKKSYMASDGFEGISLAVEHKPALIVLDILMPELSGHTTLKMLKTIKATKNIPVLMISAMSDIENLTKAYKIGTTGFITKPFTKATIYEKLKDVFGNKKLSSIISGDEYDPFADSLVSQIDDFPEIFADPLENGKTKEIEHIDSEEATPKTAVNPNNRAIKRQYKSVDSNIESIKKLLLREK